MKKLLSLFALGLCLSFGTAHAADQATCEKSAADKKLAGAAKDSHIKKCIADAEAPAAAPAAAAASAKK